MPRSNQFRLGDLQLRIMKILWQHHPASVAHVHAALRSDLAYTTVATMLRKMESRGLVTHETEGRSFLYSPAVREDAVTRNMAGDVLNRFYQGNLARMVNHLLHSREVSSDELKELETLIAQHKKKS